MHLIVGLAFYSTVAVPTLISEVTFRNLTDQLGVDYEEASS